MRIFWTDGSNDAFFTAVFYAWKIADVHITSASNVQAELGAEVCKIVAESDKAERVRNRLSAMDARIVRDIETALLSCDAEKEDKAYRYIRKIIQNGAKYRYAKSDPDVLALDDMLRKVTNEAHLFKGFLRFIESKNGVMYAPYAPDHDITCLLMRHFISRMPNIPFVIHDQKRNRAALYSPHRGYILADVSQKPEIVVSDDEVQLEALWKQYYRAVNIESRPHEKQMKGYMPVRYWKYMPEKNELPKP